MQALRRIIVALDLSETDKDILQFLAANTALLGIEKAYFLHIMPDFTVPKHVEVEFQKLFAPEYPVDEKVKDKLGFDIQEAFGEDTALDYSIEVIEGKPYEKLLHWIKVKEADLLVVGKKEFSEGSGITARRVARNAGCSILFIPSGGAKEIERIVIPVDFSKHSLHAIRFALQIHLRKEEAQLEGVYVVDLPPEDYYTRSRPGRGYRGVLMESAHIAYDSFLTDNRLPGNEIDMAFLENKQHDIANHIEEFAESKSNSMIIMGAKGHSPFETFLFGSVTEKLAERFNKLPMLVVR
ncbi:MAG: universal stress protein [Phaeodactylibacter sp.]|nr:universal stress protein [Phaeodactylibacter sp.]MCB9266493.1 universal stress protein [Lewinellaceae bacterium]MCB9289095.1 universal stress protein [Lewinellaceae bacterium]